MNHLFIAGCAHTGTTLMATLLVVHSRYFNENSPAAVELHVTYDIFKEQSACVSLTEDTTPELDYLLSFTFLSGSLFMADADYFSKIYIQQLQDAYAYFIMRMSNSINPVAVCSNLERK